MQIEEKELTRQKYINDYITSAHMFCLLLTMYILLLSDGANSKMYPSITIRLVVIISVIGFGLILLYRNQKRLSVDNGSSVLTDFLYVTLSLMFVSLVFYVVGSAQYYSEVLFLIPIIVTATIMGRKSALIMACISLALLITFSLMRGTGQTVSDSVESNLVLVGLFLLVGWYVGGITDLERQHQDYLKTVITEVKNLGNEVNRLERFNLLGEMASSISHEVRNPMTTVRGFLQVLAEKDKYVEEKEILNLMIEELDRANSMISEFLAIGKNKEEKPRLHNISNIVKTISPLIQADALGQDKYLQLNLGKVPSIMVKEKQIRQIILNLTRNGLEAMKPGGTLTISTYIERNMVIIAVKDQGGGIDPKILDKLGTPFLTTKENGTGLGLTTCYRLVSEVDASITIDTGSHGTTFFVNFPEPAL